MKTIVMIPAYNEEETIDLVIKDIPRKLSGISKVEVLVIDDGSLDNTIKVAKKAGADHILVHKQNLGLGVSFRDGLERALELGADIIVNTDADFQYNQKEIPKIIKPIIEGEADIVLTNRNVLKLSNMPLTKKYGNVLASCFTRLISGFNVKDSQSGFRAFSREAALRLNLLGDYTYVQEVIIQAVNKKLKIVQTDCGFRSRKDHSRLINNILDYAKRVSYIMIRSYVRYKPLKTFLGIGSLFSLIGFAFGLKVLFHYWNTGHVNPFLPTAVLATLFLIVGFQIIAMSLIADTIDSQRKVNEEILYRIKKREFNNKNN